MFKVGDMVRVKSGLSGIEGRVLRTGNSPAARGDLVKILVTGAAAPWEDCLGLELLYYVSRLELIDSPTEKENLLDQITDIRSQINDLVEEIGQIKYKLDRLPLTALRKV